MHTSTVTVAVIERCASEFRFDRAEVRRQYTRGTGAGGQHRNRRDTVCVLKHLPTGIIVKCEDERFRHQNEEKAWAELERRLREIHDRGGHLDVNQGRSDQIGSGMRGDKRRTYRERDDTVHDHVTGKRCRMRDVLRGDLSMLH